MTSRFVASDIAPYVVLAIALAIGLLLLLRRQRLANTRVRRASTRVLGAEIRHQVAALPVRIGTHGTIEILVISTRGSGRWTIPKGWPMRGRSDADAAAREAYEEAGVRGTIATVPIGTFEYVKRHSEHRTLVVTVYRLDVSEQVRRWRERGQRRQRWLAAQAAADCVAWTGLAEIIRSLDPSMREREPI